MNDERKAILRSMPDLVTREEVLQLVAAKPDVWRYVRGAFRLTGLAMLYFVLWGVMAFLTETVTASFTTLLVVCWTLPNFVRKL